LASLDTKMVTYTCEWSSISGLTWLNVEKVCRCTWDCTRVPWR